MSSGTKKGLLFATVCFAAVFVLYALWPTKVIHYLTKPVASENETGSARLSYRSGGSLPQVVRKKLPGSAKEEGSAAKTDMPLIIVKKIPLEIAADKPIAGGQPAGELSQVPATVTDGREVQGAVEKPPEKLPIKDFAEQLTDDAPTATNQTRLADQGSPAAKPAASETAAKKSVSSPAKSEIAAVTEGASDKARTHQLLEEKPAAHRINEPIVPKPYSIMLASCRRLDSAQKVVADNRRKGLAPFAVRVDLGQKGVWWRVFEGRYSSAAEAENIRDRYNLSQALVKKTPYAIMIGAYSSEKDAAAEVRRLESLKHTPYFVPTQQDKVALLVGAFASKNGARHLGDELAARGISNQIVNR